ncbi:hypothetical protein M8C21_011044 [Ambrosia artemisiifolia]|uniref:Uncharacterized protein n=1 Tax=Ambrosia artemisiifolia TaxID=4212 RepID=A0AAD5GP16_AMBAR|nr:hypothetical protein M8C21_011044 [Ambrosia artemisiifolia]
MVKDCMLQKWSIHTDFLKWLKGCIVKWSDHTVPCNTALIGSMCSVYVCKVLKTKLQSVCEDPYAALDVVEWFNNNEFPGNLLDLMIQ